MRTKTIVCVYSRSISRTVFAQNYMVLFCGSYIIYKNTRLCLIHLVVFLFFFLKKSFKTNSNKYNIKFILRWCVNSPPKKDMIVDKLKQTFEVSTNYLFLSTTQYKNDGLRFVCHNQIIANYPFCNKCASLTQSHSC